MSSLTLSKSVSVLNGVELANLSSLAIYFDTDAQSMADLSMDEVKEKFKSMV